jgi:hypothetical protein
MGKKCGKGHISVGKRCLDKSGEGVKYNGHTFPGFNKPIKSWLPGKKRAVLVRSGDRVKVVHYGASAYQNNYSDKAKKSYLARSAGIRNKSGQSTKDDPFSPNHWARKDLWAKKLPADGSNKYKIRGDSMKNDDHPCGREGCKGKNLTKAQCKCKDKAKKMLKIDSSKSAAYTIAYLEARKIYS